MIRERLLMPVATRTVAGRASLAVAWSGGALFVISLLWFAWFFLLELGKPVSGTFSVGALAVDVALFAAFGLHHSVMARSSAKSWFGRHFSPALERASFVWTASLALILVCVGWQRLPGEVYAVGGTWRWVLYAVQAAGILLTVRASARLDVLELAGIRQVQAALRVRHAGTGDPPGTRRENSPLQMAGPYRLVRHPVYFGWVLMVFGSPHMTTDRLALAIISTLYLAIATPLEERALRQAFGDSYREYAKRVRWRFIPGLY
jgi:protein-S-isoprenylcysteine O-methyltransferase Ste14